VVILGTGKKALETQVKALSAQYPGLAAGVVKFSNPMAHLITAGADFMLVPSRFEPCGLIQLHAMQVRAGRAARPTACTQHIRRAACAAQRGAERAVPCMQRVKQGASHLPYPL
jgi:hypothetical protein